MNLEVNKEDVVLVDIFMESKNDIPNYKKALLNEDSPVKGMELTDSLKNLKNNKYICIDIISDRVPLIDTIKITQKGIERALEFLD